MLRWWLLVQLLGFHSVVCKEDADEEEAPEWKDRQQIDPEHAIKQCKGLQHISTQEQMAEMLQDTNLEDSKPGESLPIMILAMTLKLRSNAKVVETCLHAISNLIWMKDDFIPEMREGIVGVGQGVPAMQILMKEHEGKAKIQEAALATITALIMGDEGNAAVTSFDLKLALAAMTKFKKKAELQKVGVIVLMKAALSRPDVQDQLLKLGAGSVVANAMIKNKDALLGRSGCQLLTWLAMKEEAGLREREDAGLANSLAVNFTVVGSTYVRQAADKTLKRHASKEGEMHISVCMAAAVLLTNLVIQKPPLDQGLATNLLTALEQHGENEKFGRPIKDSICQMLLLEESNEIDHKAIRLALEGMPTDLAKSAATKAHKACGEKLKAPSFINGTDVKNPPDELDAEL